jgi:hypothetical protein
MNVYRVEKNDRRRDYENQKTLSNNIAFLGVNSNSIYFELTIREQEINFKCNLTKVKFSLCLTKNHAVQTYWGMEVYLHASEVSNQLHVMAALPLGKRSPVSVA